MKSFFIESFEKCIIKKKGSDKMKFFVNLSVKKKLISVFSIISLFMISIGIQGILSSAKINEGSKAIYSNDLISIKDLEEIKGNTNEIRATTLRMVFERDMSKLDEQIKSIEDSVKKNDSDMKEYDSLPSTPEEQKLLMLLRVIW